MRALLSLLVFVTLLVASSAAGAHGMRTAYVELHEQEGGLVTAIVRSGSSHGGIRVVMPEGCEPNEGTSSYTCAAPLAGSEIAVEGLGAVVGDAVVTAMLRDGSQPSRLLRPGSSRWTIPQRAVPLDGAARYVRAGIVHVLSGPDHLLFLVALVVALRRFRAILVAETAFTLSHAITMSAAVLGWIHVPPAAAEAAIALSLVLLAVEKKAPGPWIALAFGAVHGLGFAGGLEELGLARDAIVPALAGFAAGVEIAQVAFLLGCFALTTAIARTRLRGPFATATTYAVGVTGFFWFVDRALPILRSALA
jgi:hydrogenase/urease accessory protein HupE